MNKVALTYEQLGITSAELYEQMGYGFSIPDATTLQELAKIQQEVRAFLHPSFCFFVKYGSLDLQENTLTIDDTTLSVGKIIARQLRGAEAYAFFVCTAGMDFENYQRQLYTLIDLDHNDAVITVEKAVEEIDPVWTPDRFNTFPGRNKRAFIGH